MSALDAPFSLRLPLDVTSDASIAAADAGAAAAQGPVRLWIVVPTPDTATGVDAWRSALRRWLRAHRGRVAILELTFTRQAHAIVSLAIRTAASELRATSVQSLIAVAVPEPLSDRLDAIVTPELVPYVDLVAVPSFDAASRVLAALERTAPALRAAVTGIQLDADPERASNGFARAVIASFATRVVATAVRSDTPPGAFATTLRWLMPLLSGTIEVLDAKSAALSIREPEGREPVFVSPPRLLFDNDSLSTFLFYDVPASSARLAIQATVPVEGAPRLADLGSPWRAADESTRDGAIVHLGAPRPGRPVLIDFNADAPADTFAARSTVRAARALTVDEIVARQRQEQAREDAEVDHYAALVRMQQHFRPTVTDPGYDVLTENRLFVAPDGIEWEELSFSVNGSRFGADRPPFPLLQPEKVLSLPLQLRLSDDYRYRLAGTETVNGYDCYAVRFSPARADRSLYSGTVWIDRETFARVKIRTVQTHLSAPVVSSEETQTFAPVDAGPGRPVFLLSRLAGRQIVMIAGRNLLVEREITLRDVVVNGEAFAGSRLEARRGPRVMYRDTDQGLRYFVKQGDARVVSDRPTMTAKAAAMGVMIDPSYAFPLPIVGINYLNFSFRNPETQLAMLFGGVLAAINIQRPKVPHTPFDASVDFFGIAVPSSDRRYDAAGEHPGERVITWPLTTGVNLGWQYTPFQKATFQYQFRFDAFHADTTTTEDFEVPDSTMTNGLGGAYEYRRGGYSAVFNGAWYARGDWTAWGFPDNPSPVETTYTKFSANLSRDFYPSPIQKIHLNGAYFGGQRLDRFSRYQFGLFDDTRIHGVPASGVRFDDLGMVRGSYTFDVMQLYRLDVFLERAYGRDLSVSRDWHPITGLGTALNLRAPFNTILRVDVGHALMPPGYRGIGSTTFQVLLLKPLGKS